MLAEPKRLPDAPPSRFPLTPISQEHLLAPTPVNLRARIEALRERPEFAEPINLRLNTQEPGPIIEQLARPIIAEKLLTREAERLKSDFKQQILSRVKEGRLALLATDLQWLDLNKLSATLAQNSLRPLVSALEWNRALRDRESTARLLDHFGEGIPRARREVERFQALHPLESTVPMETWLPQHMRELLGRYSPLRGRNCFATALSFNDPKVEAMRNINLIREEGHHAAMINNDEFAEALWLGYRELDEQEILEGLKFGDVVAFSDAADGGAYQGLKHAVVHVAADVYFHKPSKSASTPIEFVKWVDVVKVWSQLTRELDYKAYRKLPIGSLKQRNSQIAIEKIHWSQ